MSAIGPTLQTPVLSVILPSCQAASSKGQSACWLSCSGSQLEGPHCSRHEAAVIPTWAALRTMALKRVRFAVEEPCEQCSLKLRQQQRKLDTAVRLQR